MPTERGRAIAHAIEVAVGTRPVVREWHASHFPGMSVPVLFAPGWPKPDANTAVTLDLGDDPRPNRSLQYEFYVVAGQQWNIQQVLADVGVRVRRGSVVPEPGEVILNGIMPTYDQLAVRHLIALVPPIVPLAIEAPDVDPPVGFLQLVPFTDAEQVVLEASGRDRLAALLRKRGDDLLDLARM